jgi:HK97 family phage prohead protease
MNNQIADIPACLPTMTANAAPALNAPEFSGRLLTLSNGPPGLRGALRAQTREPAENNGRPILDFLCSDETLDRFDEIIVANGWKLENYQKNPVFQNAHQYGDILFTLGRALSTEVRPSTDGGSAALFQRIEFATDINPLAKIAYGLYRAKFLNAVSVGFTPLRWENGSPGTKFRRRYLEQELLEVSAVSIPANPHALQLGLKSGAVEQADLQELAAMLRGISTSGSPSGMSGHPFCGSNAPDGAELLQLAHAVSRLLQRL